MWFALVGSTLCDRGGVWKGSLTIEEADTDPPVVLDSSKGRVAMDGAGGSRMWTNHGFQRWSAVVCPGDRAGGWPIHRGILNALEGLLDRTLSSGCGGVSVAA